MIIGICGKSGSGKSTIARILTESNVNALHFDIDKVGHQVLNINEVIEDVIKYFGKEIMSDGIINRRKLGNLVFANSEKMNRFKLITWKHMQPIINIFLQDNKDKIIILDWILLPNTEYFDMCDIKILVDVPYEIRKQRAIKRDNISPEAFDLRDKASIEYDKNKFDIVVNNNDTKEIRKLVKQI